jgi:hypothetical protein
MAQFENAASGGNRSKLVIARLEGRKVHFCPLNFSMNRGQYFHSLFSAIFNHFQQKMAFFFKTNAIFLSTNTPLKFSMNRGQYFHSLFSAIFNHLQRKKVVFLEN